MIPMPRATCNGIEIEYETFGAPSAPPLLLIAGLGSQMLSWDDDFCALLAGRGFRVIRYDNRDSGLSTWVEDVYTLDDMADDAAGLLDALGIAAAHVVRASIGGVIAQLLTLNHPGRVLTLTSIMSGPNGDDQVQPTAEGSAGLMAPAPPTREERIALGLWAKQKLLGPADPFDDAYERSGITRAVDPADHPAGSGRQRGGILVARGRLDRLGAVGVPTLVIHGDADILVPVENGRRVAAAIPGARLMEIEGMGHDVPRRIWSQVADAIASLAHEAPLVERA